MQALATGVWPPVTEVLAHRPTTLATVLAGHTPVVRFGEVTLVPAGEAHSRWLFSSMPAAQELSVSMLGTWTPYGLRGVDLGFRVC